MNKAKFLNIIKWIARIWGSVILGVTLIALLQAILGQRTLNADLSTISLYGGLIIGLSLAYKWEGSGGFIATLGVILSRFLHPLVIIPGLLYLVHWFLAKTNR